MNSIKKVFDIKRSLSAKINVLVISGLLILIFLIFYLLNANISNALTESYLNVVKNLSRTLEKGVKDTLERGQMTNFKKMLIQQENIEGIINVSQYDRFGKLYMSSSEKDKKQKIEKSTFDSISKEKKSITKMDENSIEMIIPLTVNNDCLRCHNDWDIKKIGGILTLKYDLANLNRTKKSVGLIFLLGGILLLLLVSIMIFFILEKTFGKPIGMIMKFLNIDSTRDDDEKELKPIEINSENEIGKLFDVLKDIILRVKDSTNKIHNSTNVLSEANEDLEIRTTEAASSITETSTTLGDFSLIVKNNTKNSLGTVESLKKFNAEVQSKNELINNLNDTMIELDSSSKKIDGIVDTINGISSQTNLLALNAAIEAARVGEAGKGFAVVASEVRSLAQKTAESSNTIQEIVSQNVKYSEKGLVLVKETLGFFETIIMQINEIMKKANQISDGSKEQSVGIEQINKAIAQLESVINNNASLVEKLSKTGIDLSNNKDNLYYLVNQFHI